MDYCSGVDIGKQFQSVGSQIKGVFYQTALQEARSIPVTTILITAASWILAVIPMRFGIPWSGISFTSGYVAIFLTALLTTQAVRLESLVSSTTGEVRRMIGLRPSPCPTCAIFGEFTANFTDVPSRVEAIYIEHLAREHQVEP